MTADLRRRQTEIGRCGSWILKAMLAAFVVLLAAVFLLGGWLFVVELPFVLLTGWAPHGARAMARGTLTVSQVLGGAVLLAGALVAAHGFARWLWRAVDSGEVATPWRWRWTLLGGGIVLLTGAASTAITCVAHQLTWLSTDRAPLLVSDWAGRETRMLMTDIARVLASYRFEEGRVPVQVALGPVSGIADQLEPTYRRRLPRDDGWGGPLLYVTNESGTRYLLISLGDDARQGGPERGPVESPADDIVLADGAWRTWPEGWDPIDIEVVGGDALAAPVSAPATRGSRR